MNPLDTSQQGSSAASAQASPAQSLSILSPEQLRELQIELIKIANSVFLAYVQHTKQGSDARAKIMR